MICVDAGNGDVAHSRFGDNTWGALAGVIGSAGLRLIAVDEMVMDFLVSSMNRTPCADSENQNQNLLLMLIDLYFIVNKTLQFHI